SMAKHETYIANYYLKRGAYVASSERAKYMLETYPGAPATKDALLILIESYNNLESYNLALDNAKVLVTNYSNYSYKVNQNGKVLIHDKNIKKEEKIESSFFDLGLF
ncbi:MAG: outer membrane protein assembly factor BamD, partial [Gammaproteobacteria bacterium]